MLQYRDERPKVNRILDLTSLTVDEFETLVSAFEAAFQHRMQAWTMEGTPRDHRRYSTYASCPLPTPEDRLLFILTYVKQAPTQLVQGALFGLSQSNANNWSHVLLPVLRQALHGLGDTPARSLAVLQQRLAVPSVTALAGACDVPAAEPPTPVPTSPAAPAPTPPFCTMALSVPFRAPRRG